MQTPAPHCDALLVADIGNSRIALGIWDDDGLREVTRCAASDDSTWRAALGRLWTELRPVRAKAVVLSSVAPRTARLFADATLEDCGTEPLAIREDLPLPLAMRISGATEVGTDRVCSAAAAYHRTGQACAVASFGTATTIDCVNADGEFLGGAILPGVQMSLDALHEHTAQLPRIELAPPEGPFGEDTRTAILSGVVYGLGGALRDLVERFATHLGQWPRLVVTGGNAPLVLGIVDFADDHVPDLGLLGVAYAYRRAAGDV